MKNLDQKEKVALISVLLGALGKHQEEIDQDLFNDKVVVLNEMTDDTTPKQRREAIKKVTTNLLESL
ncbi:hypothetical protein [Bacillus wiedmannii]|uniref:hypothetical protein n=1 Tax=Bacillus wiedmannii TaxID=1890302 RepID=UPI0025A2A230|nr:hypothetical protein [Bacillus wiedmannii]MDM5266948.1 hypothetical protein [Bacillus wiedmannii]